MIKYAILTSLLALAAFSAAVIDSKSPNYGPTAPRSAITNGIHAMGIVEGATRDVELRPEIIGRVVEVRAVIGQLVSAGEVLLRLDDGRQRQLVEASRASLELANAQLDRLINGARSTERDEAKALVEAKQAQLNQAIRTWHRIRELNLQAAVSQQQADEQESTVSALTAEVAAAQARWKQLDSPARADEVREAQARIAVAEAELKLAQLTLEKCELRAPTSGCVLDVHVEPGELLGPDAATPAIVLADTSRLRVRTFVEEIDAPRLQIGMPAAFTADGLPGSIFSGTVESVSPRMSAKQTFSGDANEVYDTKVREVLVSIEDSAGLIVGLRVDAKFAKGNEQFPIVKSYDALGASPGRFPDADTSTR